jgi:hypothetical protein
MGSFVITELDDRYEFGMAIIDNDVLSYDNSSCTNSGTYCCGTNSSTCDPHNTNCVGDPCCRS